MADIDSLLLRLAASDFDSANAASHTDEDIEKAKELVEDASVRRELAESVGFEAAKRCTAYASYERVLSVLTTALFCETRSGDSRDVAVMEKLAESICFLIGSSAESSTRLLSTAKNQLRIKSDTVSQAFAKVSPENKQVGESLAKATAKPKRKQSAAESLAATEQDIIAKSRSRRMSSISRPGAHAVSGDEANALDERVATKTTGSTSKLTQQDCDAAAKNRARRSAKIRGAAVIPGVVREPSLANVADREPDGDSRRSVSSASAELSRLESDVVAKSRARSSSGMATAPGVVRESSSGSDLNDVAKDRLAKAKARRSVSASASAQLTQLESDVVSKSRARRSSRVHVNAARQSSASSQLEDLEADIMAKSGAKSTRKARSRGSDRTDMNALEGDILAKSQNQSTSSKKYDHLPSSQVPGVYFERDDGQTPVEHDDDVDDWDKEWEYEKGDSLDKDNARIRMEEGTGALLATDRGIVNEPRMEFGEYDGAQNLYADIDGTDRDTGLAVAVAVSAEEGETFIPSAVECDPDAKPPITRNRRFRLYVCLAFVLLMLIVTVVSVVMTQDSNDSPSAPTPAPTSIAESSIRNQLQIVVGEDKMNDKSSPEAMAADWIIFEDPMQLTSDSPNLIQRYVLALFYISTTQESPWLSCNRPEEGQGSECLYKLLTAVFPFIVYEQVEWYRWLSEEHECDWAGVYCDDTEVVRALELWGQEISGTLPAEFKELTYMQSIALQWNNFHGTLPKEWAEMQHLLNIEVHYNWLDGEVPEEWWTTSRWAMQRLNIAANQFSGTIPTEIGQLHGLKGFFSYENQMTGTFPTELGNVEFLAFTRQGRNFIEGTLPTEFGRLEKMQEMWLHRNKISGTIPSELGLMHDLGDLRLHFNPLSGTIPQEFYNFTELTRLDLYDCDLTGTISTEIGNMWNMVSFRIRSNNFSGTIPTEIGELYYLEEVWTHRNKFTGTVPSELCELRSSASLIGLQAVEADCGATTTAAGFGPPQIECPKGCCTRCCDGNTGICDN